MQGMQGSWNSLHILAMTINTLFLTPIYMYHGPSSTPMQARDNSPKSIFLLAYLSTSWGDAEIVIRF